MRSTALVFASILAVSTAAFAQAPSAGPASPESVPPGTPRAERAHPAPRGDHGMRDDGKSWTRAEALARAGEHFDRVDTNKDGVVDPAERKAAHEKMRAMHEQHKAGKTGGPGEGAPMGTPK